MLWIALAAAVFWWWFGLSVLTSAVDARLTPVDERLGRAVLHASLPSVSVVIAARDEAARIEATVRGLMAQTRVELEVVVVDDRSTDATPQILARLAAEFSRLRVLRVDELPPGWLGKCHACSRGAAAATGQWLLFTDGDIHMQPDLIHRALERVLAEGADHLCLWPTLNCQGALTRGISLAWLEVMVAFAPPRGVNRDRYVSRAVGIGAFNLVRAEAYRAIGGHDALRMEVVDDMMLGLLLRRGGFRQRVYSGLGQLEADWAHSLPGLIRAIEKNSFALARFNVLRSAAGLVGVLAVWLAAAAGPWLWLGWGWLGPAGLAATILPGIVLSRQAGWSLAGCVFIPIGPLAMVWAGVHSMVTTLRQGGIRWRETFYALEELRAGMVR